MINPNLSWVLQQCKELTNRPPMIMALIATTAFTTTIPRASAIAKKQILSHQLDQVTIISRMHTTDNVKEYNSIQI